jgi:predicted acyl esterase
MEASECEVRTAFPRRVRLIKHVWIPLSDGCRLSARVWLPEDAEQDPVPAVLEYIPYRKNDFTYPGDEPNHAYLAGCGYAGVRVDIRGSGDSEGLLADEYLPLEQDDAEEVIRWLAQQPWCSGAVGMMGISWGGFNALQVAARRPPELKAVISVCSTDDRYADDVHFIGGCVMACDALAWPNALLALLALPPDPEVVGDGWRDEWLRRVDSADHLIKPWLGHQRRDEYWKQGSVCEDYSAIECPVLMVGGWADGYSNAVFRVLQRHVGTRAAIVGPWSHAYPHVSVPGPTAGFLQEAVRWWDCWLKGIDNGTAGGPMLRAFIAEPVRPDSYCMPREGRWIAESEWPSSLVETSTLFLNTGSAGEGRLETVSGESRELAVASPQSCGAHGGDWASWHSPANAPDDQRDDDALSLCFETSPLTERIEVLGNPRVRIRIRVDQSVAILAARLCDVWPDGASSLVTRGLLNLTHRESHEDPSPLMPGEEYDVAVELKAVGHAFMPGHRIRLALSTTYWPIAWPSPDAVTLSLACGEASLLELPVRLPREGGPTVTLPSAESAPPLPVEMIDEHPSVLTRTRDVGTGECTAELRQSLGGTYRLSDGLECSANGVETYRIRDDDPLSAFVSSVWDVSVARGDWRTRLHALSSMTADEEAFHVTAKLDAYEGHRRIRARAWQLTIPRDHV